MSQDPLYFNHTTTLHFPLYQSSLTKPPTHLRSSPFQPLTPFILFNLSLPK